MQNFTFYSPTEVVFGKGAEEQTPALIRKYGGRRVLIVFGGKSAERSGLLARIEAGLDGARLAHEAFGGAKPNPLLSHAREGVRRAAEFGADFILAVGGGSVIDTAKGIAHGAANPGTDIRSFWTREKPLTKSLPVGVVLTISAAGSETSDSAVLTNGDTGRKRGLGTPFNRPHFAVMNPELTYTLPPFQIACGVADIMMHTLERYFTKTEGNELTDEIAEGLLRVVVRNGRLALRNSRDYEPMSELMWCGSLSHNGLTGLGAETDFATHQLGHELSARFDVAHGASLTAVWGFWARDVFLEKPERFARYAEKVWNVAQKSPTAAAEEGIARTVSYFHEIGMPVNFRELGIGGQSDQTLRELADSCMYHGERTIGRFKVLWEEDAYRIYRAANEAK